MILNQKLIAISPKITKITVEPEHDKLPTTDTSNDRKDLIQLHREKRRNALREALHTTRAKVPNPYDRQDIV